MLTLVSLEACVCVNLCSTILPVQERAKATEAQLLSTTAQLAELKAQQQLLQAKNHLLEQQQKVNKHSKVSNEIHLSSMWSGAS